MAIDLLTYRTTHLSTFIYLHRYPLISLLKLHGRRGLHNFPIVPYQHMPNRYKLILSRKRSKYRYVSTHVICKKFVLWNELLSNYLRFMAIVVATSNSTYNLARWIGFGVVSFNSLQQRMMPLSFQVLESTLTQMQKLRKIKLHILFLSKW